MRAELLIRQRITKLMIVLVALFGAVTVRIVSLAVIQGEALTARGVRQWTQEGKVAARRGSIIDRNGDTLALSATAYIVSVNPRLVEDDAAFADTVAPLLRLDRDQLIKKLGNKQYASVQLKRQVPRETVDTLRAMRAQDDGNARLLRGLSFSEDARRVYLNGAFLSQALGLTNVDSVGQSGLEQLYDTVLAGEDGLLLTEVDRKSRLMPDGKTAYVPPQQGNTLQLTIDSSIQGFTERAMRECIAAAVRAGLPTVAECGGFLYLGQSLEDASGGVRPMCGVLPGKGFRTGRLQRFGYQTIHAPADSLLFQAGERVPAHEFHYWDCTENGADLRAEKADGRSWSCGFVSASLYAAFPHLHFGGALPLAERFVKACEQWKASMT